VEEEDGKHAPISKLRKRSRAGSPLLETVHRATMEMFERAANAGELLFRAGVAFDTNALQKTAQSMA
jgi:hypothetical protein